MDTVKSNNLSLKYQMFTIAGSKSMGVLIKYLSLLQRWNSFFIKSANFFMFYNVYKEKLFTNEKIWARSALVLIY